MANKSKEDHLKTREKILETALQLISEKGLERTTFVEVGRKAGFTRGAVHSHFSDKYHIMSELILNYSTQEDIFVKEILENEKDYFQILKKVSYLSFEILLSSPQRLVLEKILLFDKYLNSKLIAIQLQSKRNNDIVFLESLFKSLLKQKKINSVMTAKDHSIALYSFILGLEVSWLENAKDNTMKENYIKFIDQYFTQYE